MIAWMRVMELVLCSASSQSLSSPPLPGFSLLTRRNLMKGILLTTRSLVNSK